MLNLFVGITSWVTDKLRSIVKFFKFVWWVIWDKNLLRAWEYVKDKWNRYFWIYVQFVWRIFRGKISFLSWKAFPSRASEEERQRYILFVEALGGWANVLACSCCAKSWHFKIVHNFLIDWEKLNQFGIKVISWEWPYLKLVPRSYSKWIFKRLKRLTDMPWETHIRYKKSFYSH